MTIQRGRALRFLAMFIMLWIGSRAVLLWSQGESPTIETLVGRPKAVNPAEMTRPGPVRLAAGVPLAAGVLLGTGAAYYAPMTKRKLFGNHEPPVSAPLILSPKRRWPEASGYTAKNKGFPVPRIGGQGPAAAPEIPPEILEGAGTRRFSLYAYGFYRPGAGPDAAIAQVRYGGSQAGAVASYRLGDGTKQRFDLLGRISYSPDDPNSLELGAGARWHPASSVPLSLAAEYRRRVDGTGTAIVYAAGGINRQPLPAGFALDAYGQAGMFEQEGVHGFFDAQASAVRSVARLGPVDLEAGAGAWAGGTDDIYRLDIGPRVQTGFALAGGRVTIAADYRFRIAGDAAPDNGPAITLATGF